MKILLIGMNHRSAPLEVRERFAVPDPVPKLQKLVDGDEISEAVIVSTCNRVDVVVTCSHEEAARHRIRGFFAGDLANGAELGNLPNGRRLDEFLYEYRDREAVSHVFRVASSLDSMVVGEPQILGQMKDAYRAAVEAGACGSVLSRLFHRAFETAKRIKNETRIAQRPVSVARVAVELAEQIFEDFADKKGLLIGAGEMIELALLALQREGLREMRVANRTRERAEVLAERFGASAHGLDELDELLIHSDIVLTCIGGEGPLLTAEYLAGILRARRNRPIFLIDIGVPRNIENAVNELDNAYLYDIDDLQEVADSNAGERKRESLAAEQLVQEEQQRFDGWLVALRAVPTIRHLRARAEELRSRELQKHLGRLGLDEAQSQGVEHLTRSIVNKILHAPLARLRSETDSEEGIATLEAARSLFALDESEAPDSAPDSELGDGEDDAQ